MGCQVFHGDCRDILDGISVTHIEPFHHVSCLDIPYGGFDSIVTDPPYGISFMSKKNKWDYEVPGPEYWERFLRVCKPGAYLIAFGGTRKFHRLYCAIEDAGWEIRDSIGNLATLLWTFGEGMPKSHGLPQLIDKYLGLMGPRGAAFSTCGNLVQDMKGNTPGKLGQHEGISEEAKKYKGFGIALKPGFEPIVLARKPLEGTIAENVLKYGTGGLNIDGCRIGNEVVTINRFDDGAKPFGGGAGHPYTSNKAKGRWPANLMMHHHENCVQSGTMKVRGDNRGDLQGRRGNGFYDVGSDKKGDGIPNARVYGDEEMEVWNCVDECPIKMMNSAERGRWFSDSDTGPVSRFFYCGKAKRVEREMGLHGRDETDEQARERMNLHSTVKPIELMRWLVRLVTPPGGVVLDPFGGSGSTGVAACMEGFDSVMVELDWKWVTVARKRVAQATVDVGEATIEQAEEIGGAVQLGLFGRN